MQSICFYAVKEILQAVAEANESYGFVTSANGDYEVFTYLYQ